MDPNELDLKIRHRCVTLAGMANDPNLTSADAPPGLRCNVPMAPLTSLELGGPARHLVEVTDARGAIEAVRWARSEDLRVAVLGGGSNVVVDDRGYQGLVLRAAMSGVEMCRDRGDVLVTAGAGVDWDCLVAETVSQGLAGLECLSGIPGLVGATPIQNVGAYGQEVGRVVDHLRILDLTTLESRTMEARECGFGYRESIFRKRPGTCLVLDVTYRMRPGGAPTLVYRELQRALETGDVSPSVADVREAVLDLRRSKSMVIDSKDSNRRSVGSFFVNPVVDATALEDLNRRARSTGALSDDLDMPCFDVGGGMFKLSAGWLIEKAGFEKGLRRGTVGLSSAHALALVHHGGGTAAGLVALAREIRAGVDAAFGITLCPEPVFLGFDSENPLDG